MNVIGVLAPLLTGVGSHLVQPVVQAIDAAIPQPLPDITIDVTPQFATAAPLAQTVGADPQRLLQAAAALYSDRETIAQVIADSRPIIISAAIEIADIGRSFVVQAAPILPSLLAGPAAVGALARLAALAGETLLEVSRCLTQLEQELAPLVETLERVVAHAMERPDLIPTAAAHTASAQLRTLAGAPAAPAQPQSVEVPAAATPMSAEADAGSAPTSEGSSEGGSAAGRAAVEAAKAQLGTPYVWGGSQPGGFDCSGLTSWAYRQAGVEIPRVAEDQTVGQQVSFEELQPGDLVVWSGHVAMYAGDGMMVEAGDPVQMSPVRTDNIGMPFMGFWRPTA